MKGASDATIGGVCKTFPVRRRGVTLPLPHGTALDLVIRKDARADLGWNSVHAPGNVVSSLAIARMLKLTFSRHNCTPAETHRNLRCDEDLSRSAMERPRASSAERHDE